MSKFLFIIENARDGSGIYMVSATTEDEAYQKMHARLVVEFGGPRYGKHPNMWSDRWEDFKDDVENGEQTMYPAEEIIEL